MGLITANLNLLKELAYNSKLDFEKICFEILLEIYPNIKRSESLGGFDRSGIDLFTFKNTNGDLDILFQCKGFQEEFGNSQLKQCLKSIEAFKKSERIAEVFYFIVNKRIKNKEYYTLLQNKFDEIIKVKLIKSYEIFDIQGFLNFLQKLYTEKIKDGINISSQYFYNQFISSLGNISYVHDVPYILNNKAHSNPLAHILKRGEIKSKFGREENGKYIFIISEFGFGKTTLLFKLYETFLKLHNRVTIYVPLGALPINALNTEADLTKSILELLNIYKSDNLLINNFKNGIFQNILKNSSDIVLLLDGIDEHKSLKSLRGLKIFFNNLKNLKPMIIFAMRKEFWDERQEDLKISIGASRNIQDKIFLSDWGEDQIISFIDGLSKSNLKSKAILKFRQMVSVGKYNKSYGDIPKRPLFLQMIISDLLTERYSKSKTSIASLYRKYLIQKVHRDLIGSFEDVVVDRGINYEGGLLSFNLKVFNALEEIASKMIIVENKSFFVQNIINSDTVEEIIVNFGFNSIMDFTLHSVLVPAEEKRNFIFKLKFAHFSFLEYFVARYLLSDIIINQVWLNYNYEPSVKIFLIGLLNEDEFSDVLLFLKNNSSITETILGKYIVNYI